MRKNLLESQKQLLKIKQIGLNQAMKNLETLRADYNKTIRQIAIELGIPEEEIKAWRYEIEYFEKIEKEEKDK